LKNRKDNLFGPTKTAKNLQKRSSKDLPTSRTKIEEEVASKLRIINFFGHKSHIWREICSHIRINTKIYILCGLRAYFKFGSVCKLDSLLDLQTPVQISMRGANFSRPHFRHQLKAAQLHAL